MTEKYVARKEGATGTVTTLFSQRENCAPLFQSHPILPFHNKWDNNQFRYAWGKKLSARC
jgi:hypothetical protein